MRSGEFFDAARHFRKFEIQDHRSLPESENEYAAFTFREKLAVR
jgi:hypothetical protein